VFVLILIWAQLARASLGPGLGVGSGPGLKALMAAGDICPAQTSSEIPHWLA